MPALPLADAIADYFDSRRTRKDSPHTIKAYRNDLEAIVGYLAKRVGAPHENLTTEHLVLRPLRGAFADFADDRERATVRRAWSTWNGFLNYLVADGIVEGNPMAGVPRPPAPKRTPKSFNDAATDRILATVFERSPVGRNPWPELEIGAVVTLLLTGVRTSELLGLDVRDVAGPDGDQVLVVRGKGDKQRSVPITDAVLAVLEAYLASRRARFPDHRYRSPGGEVSSGSLEWFYGDAPLFVGRNGERLTRGALQYLAQSVYRRAGVESERQRGALVHALRHTFATRAISDPSMTVMHLMELLGHGSLATTQNYVTAAGRDTRALVEANPLNARILGRAVGDLEGGGSVAHGD